MGLRSQLQVCLSLSLSVFLSVSPSLYSVITVYFKGKCAVVSLCSAYIYKHNCCMLTQQNIHLLTCNYRPVSLHRALAVSLSLCFSLSATALTHEDYFESLACLVFIVFDSQCLWISKNLLLKLFSQNIFMSKTCIWPE